MGDLRPRVGSTRGALDLSSERRGPVELGTQHRRDGEYALVDHLPQPLGAGGQRAYRQSLGGKEGEGWRVLQHCGLKI